MNKGVLTFFCGKMGAGKTTRARQMTLKENVVLLSEDEWLEAICRNSIASLDDYIKYSGQLKPQIKKLVVSILNAGTDVIMDFPANTIAQRDWFRGIFTEAETSHALIYIDLPNDVCIAQVAKRRIKQPERAATDTAQMFEQVKQYFVAPTSIEGINITTVP